MAINCCYIKRNHSPSSAIASVFFRGLWVKLSMSLPNDKCLILWLVLKELDEKGCTSCTCTWFMVKLLPGATWKLPLTLFTISVPYNWQPCVNAAFNFSLKCSSLHCVIFSGFSGNAHLLSLYDSLTSSQVLQHLQHFIHELIYVFFKDSKKLFTV